MKELVRIDDSSDHGGVMISASANFIANGRKVCITGDIHSCPLPGHGDTAVTGTGSFDSNGQKVMRTGDTAACGAVLQGTTQVMTG